MTRRTFTPHTYQDAIMEWACDNPRAEAVIDPPCPEMAWLRKLNKWIREGSHG